MPLPQPDVVLQQFAQEREAVQEDLPPQTQLSIDVVGSRGKRYRGTFTFRVPTLGQQVEIGRLKSVYLPQGAAADPNAALIVEQLCYLAVTIQKEGIPDWWKPFDMYDGTPVTALYAEAISYERRFHGAVAKPTRAEENASAPSEKQHGAAPADSHAVGSDVQASTERRAVIIAHSETSR